MIIFFHILLLAFLCWYMHKSFGSSPLRLYFLPALGLKLLAGLSLGLLYFVYYNGGDTLVYHHDATELADLARNDFPAYIRALYGTYPENLDLAYIHQERALLTAKVFSVFYLLTASNYWLSACYVSLLAFICIFNLAHRIAVYRPDLQKSAALAFLFWPSFVFWTSGLLKESLAMICISYLVASVLPFIMADKKMKPFELVVSLVLLILLFQIKYYYAGLLVPVLACLIFSVWMGRRFNLKEVWVAILFLFCLAAGVGMATRLHPNLHTDRFLEVWVENYELMVQSSSEGGYVAFDNLEASWGSILINSPKAIFTGLYEPLLLFDAQHIYRMVASAENMLILLLSLAGLSGWFLKERGRLTLAAFAALVYILAFALVMGIAAPNYGAIVRYRINYQPFFVLLILEGARMFFYWLRKKEQQKSN